MFATAAFFVMEADSMFEYGLAFFVLIAIISSIVVYVIFIWQSENTVKFIEHCEEFIAKSECGVSSVLELSSVYLLLLKIMVCSFDRGSFNDRLSRNYWKN